MRDLKEVSMRKRVVVLCLFLLPFALKGGVGLAETSEIRVYDDPSIAKFFIWAGSLSELASVTERFLEIVHACDQVAPETIVPSARAFMKALERLQYALPETGFSALLEDQRIKEEVKTKFEPHKQELLRFFSLSLVTLYLSGMEVFHSPEFLQQVVSGNHLSEENQGLLLDAIVKVYAFNLQNVSPFLLENIVKPLLSRNPSLRQAYAEKLGKDIAIEPLFQAQDLSEEVSRETAMERVRLLQTLGISVDLVESREGIIEGKPEKARKSNRSSRSRTRAVER